MIALPHDLSELPEFQGFHVLEKGLKLPLLHIAKDFNTTQGAGLILGLRASACAFGSRSNKVVSALALKQIFSSGKL